MNLPASYNLQISPGEKARKKKKAEEEEEKAVLRLIHFTHAPKISFDQVKLGSVGQRKLCIVNPKDKPQEVKLVDILHLRNFSTSPFLQP